jgi:TetR/AcrR family transcriptional regulator, mexJK operon transcriptional repressor
MSPRRDEQEYESKRQQIIDAALHVFASKGFEKATNKDIAGEAKIASPGLIYHYFQDKADLFRQVIQERAPILQLLDHGDDLMDLPPREALTMIGSAFLKMIENRHAVSMIKMVLGEATRRPAVAEMMSRIGPARGLAFLSHYLSHQMEIGALKKVDPNAAARCFIGPLAGYLLTREVFVVPGADSISPELMLQTTIDIFLKGLEV